MRLVRFVRAEAPAVGASWVVRVRGFVEPLVRSLVSSRPGRWILLLVAVLVTIGWMTAEFGPQVLAFTLFSPVSSTIILLICVAGVASVNWIRERAELIKRSNVRAGRCPACAYPIGELEPEADGCVVCPECGAAWRVGDPRYTLVGKNVVVVRSEPGTEAGSKAG